MCNIILFIFQKTSKVIITKIKTSTRDVHVKEYVVNTKTVTKTQEVTTHIPQYIPPVTVTSTQFETTTTTETVTVTPTASQENTTPFATGYSPATPELKGYRHLTHLPQPQPAHIDMPDFIDDIPFYGSFKKKETHTSPFYTTQDEFNESTYVSFGKK